VKNLRKIMTVWTVILLLFVVVPTAGYASQKGNSTYIYDVAGRLINVKLEDGTLVEYRYDLNGNLIRKTNTNMLMNSDFEVISGINGVADGWMKAASAGLATTFQVVTAPVSSGKYAQQMSITNMPKGTLSNLFQDVAVTGSTVYTLSGQIAVSNLSQAKTRVTIHYFDEANKLTGAQSAFQYGGNTNWLSVNAQLNTPANTVRARIHFDVLALEDNATGTLTVDAVSLQKGAHTNLLINPGFEMITKDSVADGWMKAASAGLATTFQVVTAPVSSGKYAQQMSITNMPKGTLSNLFQDVAVTGSTVYTLSGQIAVSNLSQAKTRVTIHYFDEANKLTGAQSAFQYGGNTNWLSVNAQLNTPANTVRARIHFDVLALEDNATGTLTVDAVSLQKGDLERKELAS